jgi:hypothetical protein
MIWLAITVPFVLVTLWAGQAIWQHQRMLNAAETTSGHVVAVKGCTRRGAGCTYTVQYATASGKGEFEWVRGSAEPRWEDFEEKRVTIGISRSKSGYVDYFIVTSPYAEGRLPTLIIGLVGCSFSLFVLVLAFLSNRQKLKGQRRKVA